MCKGGSEVITTSFLWKEVGLMASGKMNFYRITDDYIKFLKQIDHRILNNYNENQKRPYCGVIITINIHQYFAPLSSYKPKKHDKIRNNTIVKVYGKDKTEKLAVIHLNNMFPIIPTEIERMDFSLEEDKYKVLLEKEYSYLISNQEEIKTKALKLYNDVTKGSSFLKRLSCDFTLLEQDYIKFNK